MEGDWEPYFPASAGRLVAKERGYPACVSRVFVGKQGCCVRIPKVRPGETWPGIGAKGKGSVVSGPGGLRGLLVVVGTVLQNAPG